MMTTELELPAALPSVTTLARQLCDRYGGLHLADAVGAVGRALDGLHMMGLVRDPESGDVLRLLAERDIRLRLGLDVENAHLDPQKHSHRGFVD